eukprot:TRINITY_DN10714_c0_g1_i1.p1 TRINITY_DN10714_c0_g1~~TRINITY_DN10714_c0_g1_i1.p1  ORF type:complete len:331 (+),score=38.63 TRINITY_DN10714_c0_g1_i1:1032-2024(+)
MPRTSGFLSTLNSSGYDPVRAPGGPLGNHVSFDFQGYHVVGLNSRPNQLPMFGGLPGQNSLEGEWPENCLQNSSCPLWLWSLYAEKGYSTGLLEQECSFKRSTQDSFGTAVWHPFYPRNGGTRLNDLFCHPMWHPYKDYRPHCLFGKYGHRVILEYLNQFIFDRLPHGSPNRPVFSVAFLNEAHERSLKIVRQLDTDLEPMLQRLVLRRPHSVIVLVSDHGLHYPDTSIYSEQPFPAFFMVLPKSLLAQKPEILPYLRANEKRPITPFHFYGTLRHLLQMFYSEEVNKNENVHDWNLSVMSGVVPLLSCQEARVPHAFCDSWSRLSSGLL